MNEYEILYLAQEQNEDALYLLYQKYESIINMLIFQKKAYIRALNIDYKELYSICLLNLNEAIRKYDADSNVTFTTFVSSIFKKTINNFIYKQSSLKNRILNINIEYDDNNCHIKYFTNDPYYIMYLTEKGNELKKIVKSHLSDFEYQVYNYLILGLSYIQIAQKLSKSPKQIDNAIQRIKQKLKKREIN